MIELDRIQASTEGFFPEALGLTFVSVDLDRIVAEMVVSDALCTLPGVLHGGAVMAFADTLGAYGTALNLPEAHRTTTIESKTNFFSSGRAGTTVVGECTPLHRGRTTMVWQTRVTGPEERLIAIVIQTQIVLPLERPSSAG